VRGEEGQVRGEEGQVRVRGDGTDGDTHSHLVRRMMASVASTALHAPDGCEHARAEGGPQ